MKFKIERNLFLDKLSVVSKATASKTNMPALSGILVECSDDRMTLTSSNGEISIRVIIDDPKLSIEEDGTCLIPGKIFNEIVRKLNGTDIEIELVQDGVLRILAGSSDITLNLWDVEDYPALEFESSVTPIRIRTSLLKELIKQTTFACISVEGKPILTGVNFRIEGNKILTVSTDSFRLSKRLAELDDDFLSVNVIVPARSLNELDKILSDEEEIELFFSSNKLLVKTSNLLFITNLLEGNYPETSRLIPTVFPVVLKFDKSDLENSIDRVSTLSTNPNSTTVVRMRVNEEGVVTLTSNSPDLGTIKDEIRPLEALENSTISISFSASYFLDALRAFYGNEVYVKFSGEVKPFIIESEKDPGLLELVLPMKSD